MKMLFIVCETAIDYRVVKLLEECQVPGYTRYGGVSGVGKHSRHIGSSINPGSNTIFIVVLEDEQAETLVSRLKHFLEVWEGRRPPGLRVFELPCTDRL